MSQIRANTSLAHILGRVTFTSVLYRSDRHDPHGIEHKAEQEAIHRKLEHGLLPRPTCQTITRPNGLDHMVKHNLHSFARLHSGMRASIKGADKMPA
jgi:hypothetical protein